MTDSETKGTSGVERPHQQDAQIAAIAAGLKALAAQQSAIATQLANMAHQSSRVSDAWEQNNTIQRQAIERADARHTDMVRRQDNADVVRRGAEREYRADNIAFRIAQLAAQMNGGATPGSTWRHGAAAELLVKAREMALEIIEE